MRLELRVVLRHLGLLCFVLSALIASTAILAGYDRMTGRVADGADLLALLLTAGIGVLLGAVFFVTGRRPAKFIGQREALLLVGLSWLIGAGLAALPFRFWAAFRHDGQTKPHDFDRYINCYFEAMSGLTTTGATIVQHIATLPDSILLWRAATHWLGGLGIVVLFVAVLPLLGVGSRRLYRIEAAGPTPEGVTPRIQDTARVLWMIYMGLTAAEILALKFFGMTWFEATCHTFATLATGGFSTQDASMAAFPSAAIQIVVIVFMILAGINFGLYHQLLQRRWRSVRKDPELRAYFAIIAAAVGIIVFSLYDSESASDRPVLDATFQVISIQTTTGFCSADFDQWAFAAKATLLALMFIGGSAGSTGGGVKVMRILIAAKILWAQIEHAYRRNVVRPVKIGKTVVDDDLKLDIMVYVTSIIILFAVGTILLMLFESDIDITTAATASVATLNNIGPGLARVGATQNYAWFSDASKIVMTVLMALGRLEVFTVIALLSPRFWLEE